MDMITTQVRAVDCRHVQRLLRVAGFGHDIHVGQ